MRLQYGQVHVVCMRRVCTYHCQTGRSQIKIEFNRDVWSVLRIWPPGLRGHRTMDVPPYAYARDHPNTTGCPTRRHETESVAHEYILRGRRGRRDEDDFDIRLGSSAGKHIAVNMCPRGPTPTRACKRSAKSAMQSRGGSSMQAHT